MGALIYDTSAHAFKDSDNPKVKSGGAWADTDGKVYQNGAWVEAWSAGAWSSSIGVAMNKRTEKTPSNTAIVNSTKRKFDNDGYYLYLASNNYYNNYNGTIVPTDIQSGKNSIQTTFPKSTGGFDSIAFPVTLVVGNTYHFHAERTQVLPSGVTCNACILFYSSDGTFISNPPNSPYNDVIVDVDFTVPANTVQTLVHFNMYGSPQIINTPFTSSFYNIALK